MKILLDHCVAKRARELLEGHAVKTARQMGWHELKNGDLLLAAGALFDAVLTVDKNMRHQRNLDKLPIAVILLDSPSSAFSDIQRFGPYLGDLIKIPLEKMLYVIGIDGKVFRVERQ
jgi:hypothetical protein